VAVSGEVSVIGWERVWRRCNSPRKPCRGVHDLVADEDTGPRFHSFFDGGEDLDAVVIGPIVSRLVSVFSTRLTGRGIKVVGTYKIYRSQ
jgi:hypothetical protein